MAIAQTSPSTATYHQPSSLLREQSGRRHRRDQDHLEAARLLLPGDETCPARDPVDDEQHGEDQGEELGVEEAHAGRHGVQVEHLLHRLGISGQQLVELRHVPDRGPQGAFDDEQERDPEGPTDDGSPLVAQGPGQHGRVHGFSPW